jgi:hypothetical protein
MTWKRIGIALAFPKGETRRRDEYEIVIDPEFPDHWHIRYTGYREQRPNGEAMVGLPLGGPGWRPQPLLDYDRFKGVLETRLFNKDEGRQI